MIAKTARLTERITLASPVRVADAYGQGDITWTDEGTVWAEVKPLQGREYFAAAQVQQEHSIKVYIRRRDDVQQTWRLTWNGQHYDITNVSRPDAATTEIRCVQGVKDGR